MDDIVELPRDAFDRSQHKFVKKNLENEFNDDDATGLRLVISVKAPTM